MRISPVVLALLFTACGAPAAMDAAMPDAGTSDLGAPLPDLGMPDVGAPDLGTPPPPRRFVTDDLGRALVFHGVNVDSASKDDPLRMPHIDEAGIAHLSRDWGMNFVRLLIFWDALEPTEGVIDLAYLDRVEALVALFAAEGVAVMLDMHQDVYAHRFCCDGAPDWAIRDDGEPFVRQDPWGLNYLQPAVVHAFDNFWDATGPNADVQTHYVEAWAAVAERFAGNPAVVGYDLMNEPSSGSLFDPIEAISRTTARDGGTSRIFDETKLGPFHQRLVDRIREVDMDAWIFFEPRFAAPANGSPSFLPVLEDPRGADARLAYAPHLYSAGLEATHSYSSSDRTVPEWERQRIVDLARQDCPGLLGEWGLAFGQPGADEFAADVVAMADRQMLSWAYWSWDPSGPTGWGLFDASTMTDNPQADLAVRAYPRAVAGVPTSWSFDPATSALDLVLVSTVDAPSELVLPARVYPAGFDVAVDGAAASAASTSFDATHGVLSLTTPMDGASHHVVVTAR